MYVPSLLHPYNIPWTLIKHANTCTVTVDKTWHCAPRMWPTLPKFSYKDTRVLLFIHLCLQYQVFIDVTIVVIQFVVGIMICTIEREICKVFNLQTGNLNFRWHVWSCMSIMHCTIVLNYNFRGHSIFRENREIGPLENFPLYGVTWQFRLSLIWTGAITSILVRFDSSQTVLEHNRPSHSYMYLCW